LIGSEVRERLFELREHIKLAFYETKSFYGYEDGICDSQFPFDDDKW